MPNWTLPGIELWRLQMTAVAKVLSREAPAPTPRQPNMEASVIRSVDQTDRPSNLVKEHLILGTDKQDAENQRDLWLSENPFLKIVRIHDAEPEPQTLLMRLGRKHVPHVSILVEYEDPKIPSE
jgi:hypothetical protein